MFRLVNGLRNSTKLTNLNLNSQLLSKSFVEQWKSTSLHLSVTRFHHTTGELQSAIDDVKLLRIKARASIKDHPRFKLLKKIVENPSSEYDTLEAVNALDLLDSLSIPLECAMGRVLQEKIEINIADLTLNSAIQLSRTIKDRPHFAALRLALPTVVDRDLRKNFNDLNILEKSHVFLYILNARGVHMRTDSIAFIEKNFIESKSSVTIRELMDIIMQINEYKRINSSTYSRPIIGAIDKILVDRFHELTFEEICLILQYYVRSRAKNSNFGQKTLEFICTNELDFSDEIFLLSLLNECKFDNVNALGRLITTIEAKSNELKATTSRTFSKIIYSLAINNHLPSTFASIIWPTFKENPLYRKLDTSFNWMKILSELLSLEFYDADFIAAVINPNYLNVSFAEQQTEMDYKTLWMVYQFLMLHPEIYSLPESIHENVHVQKAIKIILQKKRIKSNPQLEQIYGDEVLTNVRSKLGHFIQHLFKIDVNTRELVKFDEKFRTLEAINVNDGQKLVAVNIYRGYFFLPESHQLCGSRQLYEQGLRALNVMPIALNSDLIQNEKLVEIIYERINDLQF